MLTCSCVGRAPHIDQLVAYGVGARVPSLTRLKKAGAACLEFGGRTLAGARLMWLFEPKVLRRLGAG